MTKLQLHSEVTKLLENYEAQFKSKTQFKDFKSQMDELLKPKSGGGIIQNPMKTIDGVNYHFCRYTGYYLPEAEMVLSNGKSKGYSKKAIAKWTKAGKTAQTINDEAMKLLLSGDTEAGKLKAEEAEKLKNDRNKVSYYDDIRDLYAEIKLED